MIDDDTTSERKRLARVGQRYYEGDHDIKDYRLFYYNTDGELVEDKTRSNERISHPFFTELVDQLTAYVLSNPENIIKSDDSTLQEHLDEYFDEDFWAEISELLTGSYAKGFEYLYAYKNAEDRIAFDCADGLGVIEVRAKDTDDNTEYHIYWYIDRVDKGRKPIVKIQVHTDRDITYFEQSGKSGKIELDKDEPINPKPNVIYVDDKGQKSGKALGFVPFFRFDYNKKQVSGLKPIKGLIDDYDLMECGLSNNLQDFDTPIHIVKGFQGDNLDELQQNIKTKKIVGVDSDGGMDVMTVDVPYEARKTKADEDEKNIYRFGMGLNTIGLKDTSATTNIAIKMAYTLLDLKAEKVEKRLKKFLKQIIKIVLAEINEKNGTGYQVKDVYFDFKHDIIVNEQENAQNEQVKATTEQVKINTILNIAAYVGDEQTLRAICEIMDWDFDELQSTLDLADEEADTLDAMETLEGIEPDDDDIQGISDGEKESQQAVLEMLDELLKELE